MNESKRSLLAAALSFLVLIGWYFFFGKDQMKPSPPALPPAATATNTISLPEKSGVPVSSHEAEGKTRSEKINRQETSLWIMDWTDLGGRPKAILLKKYQQDLTKQSPPTNLLPFEGEKALSLRCEGCGFSLPAEADYAARPMNQEGTLVFQASNAGVGVQKQYEWKPDQYLLNVKVSLENKSDRELRGRLGLGWRAKQFVEKQGGFFSFLKGPTDQRTFLYKLGQDVTHNGQKDEVKEIRGAISWAGIEDRYFLISLISRRLSSDQLVRLQRAGEWLDLAFYPDPLVIPPHGKYEEQYSLYLGPKQRESLQSAGVGLEEAVDYGWFSLLAIPILKLLQIFYSLVKNWGLAVILLTLFAKILLNPLTIKSMKQMKEMQKIQPQLAALKEKYKNDKQRINMETMQLFKDHKVNPMGGCLPMFLQMPIYIALYKVLYNSIELYHAPFFGFYKDLAAPDPYFILPVLLGVAMVAQQKLTPSASVDPAQKQMMTLMPIMFTAFMLFLPLGLVLYIFVNTVTGVIQQWMYQKGIRWRDVFRGRLKVT